MAADEPAEVVSPPVRTRAQAIGEAAVVLLLGCGLFLDRAFADLRTAASPRVPIDTADVLGLVAFELVIAALVVAWLGRRGWTLRAVTPPPSPRDVVSGAGLWLLAYVVYVLSFVTWSTFAPEVARQAAELTLTGTVALPAAVALAIVNPFFEEFLFLGYGITALERFGLRTAFAVSVGLRTAIHAYQGAMAIVGLLPMFIVITLYFVRTRRLWPVIVAHIIVDAIALGTLVRPAA